MKFKKLNMLAMLTVTVLLSPMSHAIAGDVSLEPGYITGQVKMGNAEATFTTTSISTNASGGGYTSSKSTGSSENYTMTVQGGDWNTTVTASAGFSSTNSSPNTVVANISSQYNNRTIQVSPGESVTNDYVNTGVIKFQLNITGDPTSRFQYNGWWYAQKATTANEKTYTQFLPYNSNATTHRNAYWYVPVAPNQGISVTGSLSLYCAANGLTRTYSFNKTVDVNPNQTVEVPLNIENFTCPVPSGGGGGGGTGCTTYPSYGTVNFQTDGVNSADFYYQQFSNIYMYTNPSSYSGTVNLCAGQTYSGYAFPSTGYKNTAEGILTWPYLGGVQANNLFTYYSGETRTKDYQVEVAPLSGTINFTGTVTNADLYQYSASLTGQQRIYNPTTRTWGSYLPTNGGSFSLTRHKTSASYKRPIQLDYLTYFSPGDWYTGQWTAQKIVSTPYTKTSSLNFTDHNTHYDGYTYTFGTPVHIDAGVQNTRNFEYCMGSAIFRFRDVTGNRLSNPYVNGNGSHVNSNNKTDMNMTVTGQASVSLNSAPEVEIFGPTGNYTLTTVRVIAQDNSTITFPAVNVKLNCNTTKIFDIPGPTLNVTNPSGELITNALSVPVTGRAFSGSTMETVTVNGQATTLTLITGGQNNEVSFSRDLPLADGRNTVNIIATDVSGAQANDQIIVSVDRWLPTATISNGDRFANTETSIPFTVTAADRGYGYTLQVSLDGVLINTTNGAGNDATAVPASYAGTITNITLGTHTITAVATDLAGNTISTTSTIEIYEARDNNPPVINRLGDAAVSVEAGSVYTDAGATALDDRDGDISAAIITTNPINTLQVGSYTVAYNVADAAGNAAAEVTRQVTVADTTAPVLTAPADKTIEATGLQTVAEIGQATATDLFSVTISNNAPATYPVGITTITWTATDANGNNSSAAQTVTVVDTTPPTLQGLANQTIEATSAAGTTASFTVTATDLADPAVVANCTAASGSTFAIGENTVTCTAKDASNNTTTGSFVVKVQDTIAPVVTSPANITVEATGKFTTVTIGTASAIDTVGVESLTSNAPEAGYPLGTTTVTWTAKDAVGNIGTATQTVTVVDTTPPQISGVNQVIEATSPDGATASYTVATSDNAGTVPAVSCSAASGSTFALGENTVTCTATDASGNSATGSFIIKVQDTTPPALTVPSTITVLLNTSTGAPAVLAFLNGATATDIVDTSVTITSSATPLFTTVGTKTVTFTAVDDNNNTTVKTATINVVYGCGDTYLNNEETNFLTPVNLLKPFKLGSTIPVKLHLCDAGGADIMTAVARIYLQMFSNNEPVGDPIEVTSTSGADTGNYFRVSGSHYMYNLYTKNLSSGSYQIQAVLDDGTTRTLPLFLKQ